MSGTTTLASPSAPLEWGLFDTSSSRPVFSPDGTRIAFESRAHTLGPRDTNGQDDLYVHDLTTGETSLVTTNVAGTDSAATNSPQTGMAHAFTPDGTGIVFDSSAHGLVPNDANDVEDVFVRDLETWTTRLLSANAPGTGSANGSSSWPTISRDGTAVLFESTATDLGPTDTNGADDVFVADMATGVIRLVSANAAGSDSANAGSRYGVLHPDGRRVALVTGGSDLGPVDTNGRTDVYMVDLVTGEAELLSTNAAGTDSPQGTSAGVTISPEGSRLAFTSDAANLGFDDTNGRTDLFVENLTTNRRSLVSTNAAGTGAASGLSGVLSSYAAFSPDGTRIVYESTARDIDPRGGDGNGALYLATLAPQDP